MHVVTHNTGGAFQPLMHGFIQCRLESGVLPQLVLFTFLVHKSNTVGSEGQRQASMINSVGSRSSTPPLPPPAPSSAKPVEMITLKSGVSAEVVVVGGFCTTIYQALACEAAAYFSGICGVAGHQRHVPCTHMCHFVCCYMCCLPWTVCSACWTRYGKVLDHAL